MNDQIKRDLEKAIVVSLIKTIISFTIKNNIDLESDEFSGLLSSIDLFNVDLSKMDNVRDIIAELIK